MMDKTFLVYVSIGIGFLYLITHYVGGIQAEDDKYRNKGYEVEHKYDQYQSVDSIGQEILNLTGADANTQVKAWNKSNLKNEFIGLYPDFSDMKAFVKDRIIGDALKTKLLNHIKSVEDRFFSGEIDAEQAKRELESLH